MKIIINIPDEEIRDFKPREPYDDDFPDGYMESDRDFTDKNYGIFRLVIEQVEAKIDRSRIKKRIKS